MPQPTPDFGLYVAAIAADNAFQDALVRAYGPLRAGDARYRYEHTDAGVLRAKDAKLAADRAWLAEMRRIDGRTE